jgi:predicted ester cyclase
VYRIENGKIAELWSEIDFLGIMTQISPIPAQ